MLHFTAGTGNPSPTLNKIRQTAQNIGGGMRMHEEEKKPTPWEAGDPKLPVVKSGNQENRRAY